MKSKVSTACRTITTIVSCSLRGNCVTAEDNLATNATQVLSQSLKIGKQSATVKPP